MENKRSVDTVFNVVSKKTNDDGSLTLVLVPDYDSTRDEELDVVIEGSILMRFRDKAAIDYLNGWTGKFKISLKQFGTAKLRVSLNGTDYFVLLAHSDSLA